MVPVLVEGKSHEKGLSWKEFNKTVNTMTRKWKTGSNVDGALDIDRRLAGVDC